MAVNVVKYPIANMVQFVPEKAIPDTVRHDFRHYNEWWQCERNKPSDNDTPYFQKLEQGDRLSLMFHSNNGAFDTVEMDIYDARTWQLALTVSAATISITGFEIEEAGVFYPANTHIISQSLNNPSLPEGLYYFVLRIPFTAITIKLFSEVIFLRETHPKTLGIKYSNSENDFDLFFQGGYGFAPTLRVESAIYDLSPTSDDTSYIDERIDPTLLYSTPYDTYTYTVNRVPEWMISKVNRAFSCDTLGIYDGYDTKYYNKTKDAKWDVSSTPNEPLKTMSITIQEADNSFSQSIAVSDPITVWQMLNEDPSPSPTRFPYFVRMATINRTGALPILMMTNLTGGVSPYPYSTDCLEVRNTSDEAILLNHANNVTRPSYGQLGYYEYIYFGVADIKMVYYPAPSETNYTSSNYVVLSRFFEVNFENGAYGGGQFYDIKGSWIGYAAVLQSGTHSSAGYGNGNPTITYYVGGNSINLQGDIARVYHHRQNTNTNTISVFRAKYDALTPNIKSITKTLPEELEEFRVTSGAYYQLFNWLLMGVCKDTIWAVEVYGNALVAVLNMTTYFGQQLTEFGYYDVSDNNLNVVNVDSVFNQMYNGGSGNEVFLQNSGEMYTDGQTPPAPPSGTSAAAVTFIDVTKSWVVGTD